jgi:hypothetical protein
MDEPLDRRIRRGWRLYAVGWAAPTAVTFVSAILVATLNPPGPTLSAISVIVICYGGLAVTAYTAADYNSTKPHLWGKNVATTGLAAVIFYWFVATRRITEANVDRLTDYSIAIVAVWLVGALLAVIGKGITGGPHDPDEVIDTDLAVILWARGDAKVKMEVDTTHITMSRVGQLAGDRAKLSSCRLQDVTSVKIVRLTDDGTRVLPGRAKVSVKVSRGPALRLRTRAGEWIFPTDDAVELCKIVKSRVKFARRTLPVPVSGLELNRFL